MSGDAHTTPRRRVPEAGDWGKEAGDLGPAPWDPRAWFAEAGPLELEIGSGKGTFLVEQAAHDPGVNRVGLEPARAYWRHAADRCRRHGLKRVRVVHAAAETFLERLAPSVRFRGVHVYYPDPWPKKRHHKRRLIARPFLERLHAVLEPAGELRLVTDYSGYFEQMLEAAAGCPGLWRIEPYVPPRPLPAGEWAGTNYERKFRAAGRRPHGAILRAIDGGPVSGRAGSLGYIAG